jgi:serine/threonine-protein kinase HipA
MNNSRLNVSIVFDNDPIPVGELVIQDKKIYFRYSSEFVSGDIQISPFKLKLSNEIVTATPIPFDGLFGVFNDSLPDGWGRLLLDRKLAANGIAIETIHPLDRLAFVGQTGMGALIYEPAIRNDSEEGKVPELDFLADEMQALLKGDPDVLIDELYQLGGSSGGARPKINVGYNRTDNTLVFGVKQLPEDYEHWMIKFPSSIDRPDVAQIEMTYYRIALAAGLEMSECQLFHGASDRSYFGTKRFDRDGNNRLHMHSASGLLHDDFRLSNMDYGHLMDAAFRLERHVGSYEKILRLAAFNVFSHNRDDHSKNMAFLMDKGGKWQFAPVYDLTFSSSSHGFHSTMVAGESQNPGDKQLLELASHFRVKNAGRIIEEVKSAVSEWEYFAKQSGVSEESRRLISRELVKIR